MGVLFFTVCTIGIIGTTAAWPGDGHRESIRWSNVTHADAVMRVDLTSRAVSLKTLTGREFTIGNLPADVPEWFVIVCMNSFGGPEVEVQPCSAAEYDAFFTSQSFLTYPQGSVNRARGDA